jgi:hypothetical protein
MKKFFNKYILDNGYKIYSLMIFIELIINISLYVSKYPNSSIYNPIFWAIIFIISLFIVKLENKYKKSLENLARYLQNITNNHEKKDDEFKFGR